MGTITEGAVAEAAAQTDDTNTTEIPRRILRALSAPFKPNQVRWRLGNGAKMRDGVAPESASALAYIDARDCHNRLDSVLGLNWECSYSELRQGKLIMCRITVIVNGQKITRENGADSTDIEPDMGAASCAFRRAATMFGVGRDLYGYPSPWVKVKTRGKSLVIDPTEMPKLKQIVAEKCAEWEKREAERLAKKKPAAKPAEAPTPAAQEAAPEPPTDETADPAKRLAIRLAWEERMAQAQDAATLKAIAAEIAKGPFPTGSEERTTLQATYAKEMKRIDPAWKPTSGRR